MSPPRVPKSFAGGSRRRGITSLDLLVSVPSSVFIIVALGACVTLLARSNSQDERFYRDVQQVADASIQMAMEIEMANAIARTSPTAIEFCVPDRNGDFLPEQIRYEWKTDSVTDQGTLFRKINQGVEAPIITNLKGFELQYTHASASSIPNRFLSESVLLKKVDSVPSVTYFERSIDSVNQLAIIFRPDNSATFATWDLGSIELMLRSENTSASGKLRVRVTTLSNNVPDLNNVDADIEISNQDLSPKYQYVEFPLAPIAQIPSSTAMAVVLSTSAENPPIRVQCLTHSSNMPNDLRMLLSSNQGTSWTSTASTSPRFLAMGFTSGSSSTVSARRNLISVDILMTGLTGIHPTRVASARLLAQPEVP